MDRDVLSYDVVVVGGGAAGLAAAVAAGGAGARTALVERYGFLGGMATAGMVSTICGLYHGVARRAAGAAQRRVRRRPSPAGWPPCPAARSRFAEGGPSSCRTRRSPSPASRTSSSPSIAQLDVYLHAYLVGVDAGAGRIDALRIATSERTVELRATAVVDTSGDAVVARQAGAATETAPLSEPSAAGSSSSCSSRWTREALGAGPRVALAADAGRPPSVTACLPKGASNLTLGPVVAARGGHRQARPRRCRGRSFRAARLPDRRGAGRPPARARRHRVPEDAAGLRASLRLPRGGRRSASARAGA